MGDHRVLTQVVGNVGGVQAVVGKELFDHVAFESQADHEIIQPIVGVDFHDVPENRPPSNLDHWFGPYLCLFGDAGA